MDYQLSVQLRNCTAARAHLYGAQALILDKQVKEQFLPRNDESIDADPLNGGTGFVVTSELFSELCSLGIVDRHWMLMGHRVHINDDLPDSLDERQWNALALAQEAREARLRYYRELESVDLLGGHSSAFTTLAPDYAPPMPSYPGHLPSPRNLT